MSDIRFNCPQCEQALAVDAADAGTTVVCPNCGLSILAPEMARLTKTGAPGRIKWWLLAAGVAAAVVVASLLFWQRHLPSTTQIGSVSASARNTSKTPEAAGSSPSVTNDEKESSSAAPVTVSLGGPQVLNMSHDLMALGIASQNMVPNSPSLDARPLFQATLQYIRNHPVRTITLDTGSYYMLTPQQANAVLVFSKLSNMVVDLAGSTFYFSGPFLSTGFVPYFCTNFTLANFRTDYIKPPYTHVRISSVDAAHRLIHYQTLRGWPDPSTFNNLTNPFGGTISFWAAVFRDGQPVFGTTRTAITLPMMNETLTLTQDGTPWTQSPTLATLQAGDTAVITARAGGPVVQIWRGDAVTLSNATIYGANSWAVELYEIGNSVVDHVNVMPRPGTGLVGANADGIHINSAYQNNHIRHCYVARTMDDALIMDSQILASVVGTSGPRRVTVRRYVYDSFPDGTPVNFVNPLTTAEIAGGTIVSQTPADSESPGYGEQVVLTFDRDLPALSPGRFIVYGSAPLRGQGSTFEDNTVEDIIAGRGIWITGLWGATVSRNVIRRTSMGGIVVHQDTEAYPSPPVQNITITDNVLEGVSENQATGTGIQESLGAIEVVSTSNQSFGFASGSPNANVSLVNNYIADSGRSGIWIGELNGEVIENNLIIRYSQQPELGGTFGILRAFASQVDHDALAPVVIRYSANIRSTNNTIAAKSTITAPVTFAPTSASLEATAGRGSFTLRTAVSSFAWAPTSDSSWLTVTSGATGSGTGTVRYSVAANQSERVQTGHIIVAGKAFTVMQSPALR